MSPVDVPFRIDGPADAPPVLLSNSLGTTSEMWDPQVPALSERYRVVRYDTRGHGGAPVPNGPYSLDDLGGDALALLDRLVAMCTSAMLSEEHDWPARAKLVREQGTSAVAQASIERWFTPGFVAANPDTVARLRATLADTPPEGYAGCCDAIAGMDLLDAIESVAAPTLVIAGRQDPATPPPHAERIAERIPGARLELVDAAHLANIELADDVTALTLAHLEGR